MTLLILGAIGGISIKFSDNPTVMINEVRSRKHDGERQGYSGSDYIELYNASEETISLDGWYLSDEETDLEKSRLSNLEIKAKGYLIILADGIGAKDNSVNFRISSNGEKIFLTNSAGILMDSIFVPAQEFGTVYARLEDGVDEWGMKEPTAGFSNGNGKSLPQRNLEAPVFSQVGGFYDEAFTLTIEAKAGERIYYTLDGGTPTEESCLYEDGILIENISAHESMWESIPNPVLNWKDYKPDKTLTDKAMVVRAVAMDGKGNASEIVTHTYFVGLENYEQGNVVSLVADWEDLFGEQGIYVTGKDYDAAYLADESLENILPNFRKNGREWEIVGNMEIYQMGDDSSNQEIGLRIQGNSSRDGARKRFSIYSREEYSGSEYFENLPLGEKEIHSVTITEYISGRMFPELLKDRNIAVQNGSEAAMFLNGEYLYTRFILEKFSGHFLEETYGVGRDNVIIIKDRTYTAGPEDSYEQYMKLVEYAQTTDLSVAENYEQLMQMMDVQSYIDYLCANIYLCNMDASDMKNYMAWRTIEKEENLYGDGRWRWMIHDIDCIQWAKPTYYNVEKKAQINTFAVPMKFTKKAMNEQKIYAAAKANEDFCKQFVLSFMDMSNVNFKFENVKQVFADNHHDLEVYGDFFELRYDYIVQYLAEEFDLKGTLEEVELKINDAKAGKIILNTTVPPLDNGGWEGKYYTDYPITVTAEPEPGYEFVGWKGTVNSDSEKIEAEVLEGGILLEAVFRKVS